MDRQQIFDTGLNGLIKQGHRAMTGAPKYCVYRTPTGAKCFLGHSIPDNEYDPEFEREIPHLYSPLKAIFGAEDQADIDFLREAQSRLHDSLPDVDFTQHLLTRAKTFAKQYNLEFNPNAQ